MNRWRCQHPDCQLDVAGSGGAIGLRAIGWFFESGPVIFCPRHRPDPIAPINTQDDEVIEMHGLGSDVPCSQCRGDVEAKRLQRMIGFADREEIIV